VKKHKEKTSDHHAGEVIKARIAESRTRPTEP
jgi:hypothetical protein